MWHGGWGLSQVTHWPRQHVIGVVWSVASHHRSKLRYQRGWACNVMPSSMRLEQQGCMLPGELKKINEWTDPMIWDVNVQSLELWISDYKPTHLHLHLPCCIHLIQELMSHWYIRSRCINLYDLQFRSWCHTIFISICCITPSTSDSWVHVTLIHQESMHQPIWFMIQELMSHYLHQYLLHHTL